MTETTARQRRIRRESVDKAAAHADTLLERFEETGPDPDPDTTISHLREIVKLIG